MTLLLTAAPASAEIVVWEFTGEVTDAAGTIEGLATLPFAPGDPFTGEIEIDWFDAPGSWSAYGAIKGLTFTAGSLTMDVPTSGAFIPTCSIPAACAYGPTFVNWLDIREAAVAAQDGNDLFYLNTVAHDGMFDNYYSLLDVFYEDGYHDPVLGPPGPLWNFDPMNPPDPASLDGGVLQGYFSYRAPAQAASSTSYTLNFELETLSVVPEPSAGILLTAGLGALSLLHEHRRRQNRR